MKKIKITWLIMGILTVISCSPKKEISENKAVNPQKKEISESETISSPNLTSEDSLANPFTFTDLALPYFAGSCGTVVPGAEVWIWEEEAQKIIAKVFKDEGIDLQKNYHYKKDSVSVALDSFDPNLNIGYIWLDFANLGEGLANLWSLRYYDSAISFERGANLDMSVLERLLNKTSEKKSDEAWHQRFEAANKITDETKKLQAYKALYLDDLIEYIRNHDTSYAHEYFNTRIDNFDIPFEEKEKLYKKSALINGCMSSIHSKNTLKEILYDIVEIKNENERKRQYNNFVTFLITSGNQVYKIKDKILAHENQQIIADEIQKFGFKYLDKRLSQPEVLYLENIHNTEGDFIAMIGMQDKRFTYKSVGLDYRTSLRIRERQGQEGIQKAYEEDEKRAKGDHAKMLKAFEAHVRQYIKWAKQQSGY